MKFVLIGFIWIAIIGSVILYLESREPVNVNAGREKHISKNIYNIEILASSVLEPDIFLQRKGVGGTGKDAPSLRILLNGIEVVRDTGRHEEMISLHYKNIAALEEGKNEFYIEAFFDPDISGRDLSLRMRIMEGRMPRYEKTFWSDGENSIRGTFIVEIPKKEE